MAKLFPNKLRGNVPAVVARTFRQLKKLPDDFCVWFNLADSNQLPHFMIIWQQRCAYLLHVTATSQQLVETAIHGDLFQNAQPVTIASLGATEKDILRNFTKDSPELEQLPIKQILFFPNVSKGTLDTITAQHQHDENMCFLGKQEIQADRLTQFLKDSAPTYLTEPQLIQLRHRYTPETSVPKSFSPVSLTNRNRQATLTPQLLDVDQEWCMKNNLYLPQEAEQLTTAENASTSQLVTGVAGSGKSLVLLYRALLNAKLNPGANVLVLTHNKAINNELQTRFTHLSKENHKVTWLTFFGWARQQLDDNDPNEWHKDQKIVYPEQALNFIEALNPPPRTFSSPFLLDEFGFIKDHNIRSLAEYQQTPRTGQGRSLKTQQRSQLWQLFKQYQQELDARSLTDWHNIAMRFHKKAMNGLCSFPSYHCILIDEAQFFAKAWFDIVKKALLPGGQIFLSADPTQGFLKRRQSWISSGIEVRGRTTKLTKPYRNSQEILRFATEFYHRNLDANTPQSDQEHLNLLTEEQITSSPLSGHHPQIITSDSEQESISLLIKELEPLAAQLSQPTSCSILILHADSKLLTSLEATLRTKFPTLHFHSAKSGIPAPSVFAQTSSVNGATGLEASIVFLLGIDKLIEKQDSPLLSEEMKASLRDQHNRQLYMAFTRAAQRLIIFSNRLK